jgi:hypothetical protein
LRPGQYSPHQGPPTGGAEDLPPGAVRVTTTTPTGTTVQYYPPAPDPNDPQMAAPQRPRPRRASATRRVRPRAQPQTRNQETTRTRSAPERPSVQYNTSSSIAVPEPVQIPQDRDPRTGWEATFDKLPADNL